MDISKSLPEHAIQFIDEYFSILRTRYIMFELGNLDTLICISKDAFFEPEVYTLGISTKHLSDSDELFNAKRSFWSTPIEESGSHDSDFWHGNGIEPRFDDNNDIGVFASSFTAIRCQYFKDQEGYVSDHDVDALTRAIGRLHNCKTLILTDVDASWEY